MISFKFFIFIGLVAYLCDQANGLGCKNEKDEDVDWSILLKPPKQKSANPILSTGGGYSYIDSNTKEPGWILSEHDIGSVNSYIGKTFAEVYSSPEKYSCALVWDNENTVFLSHSTPKFLPIFHLKKYSFPETGKIHGQNFMCVTFKTKDNIKQLLEHLVTMKVQVYANHISRQLSDEISGLIQEDVNILAKITKKNKNELQKNEKLDDKRIDDVLTSELKSKNGNVFKLVAKSRKDNVDIWSKIAPHALGVKSMAVKSWTLLQKVTALLTSTCSLKERILNVMDMNVLYKNLKSISSSWGKNDHSKWGLCLDADKKCYCQGDMNRATSQFKRGGGLLCIMNSPVVQETIENSYSNQFSCKNKLESNQLLKKPVN